MLYGLLAFALAIIEIVLFIKCLMNTMKRLYYRVLENKAHSAGLCSAQRHYNMAKI